MADPPRVVINGFGRIGRLVARAFLEAPPQDRVALVAVNDVSPPDVLAHLFQFDSAHGRWPGPVEVEDGHLRLDGHHVRVLHEKDPAKLPWRDLGVDIAVESSGRFRTREDLGKHLEAGARRVLLTAPAKKGAADVTLVRGVNMGSYDPGRHHIVSNSSCTTNGLAPVLKVLDGRFGIDHAVMTTVHAYTNDQKLLDTQHSDLRRARAAAVSIIPTTTGAAEAITAVMPEMKGKVDGMAIRVPVANVSLLDVTAKLHRGVEKAELDEAFRAAAEGGPLRGILAVEERPLVSVDFNHHPASCIVDIPGSMVVDHSLVKVLAWYDNEWAYAKRVTEVVADMGRLERGAGAAALGEGTASAH